MGWVDCGNAEGLMDDGDAVSLCCFCAKIHDCSNAVVRVYRAVMYRAGVSRVVWFCCFCAKIHEFNFRCACLLCAVRYQFVCRTIYYLLNMSLDLTLTTRAVRELLLVRAISSKTLPF